MLKRALVGVLVLGIAFSFSLSARGEGSSPNLRPLVEQVSISSSESWGPFDSSTAEDCAAVCDGTTSSIGVWPSVVVGDVLAWDIVVENLGDVPAEESVLRVSWRRQDKQAECGFAQAVIPSVPAASGSVPGLSEPIRTLLETEDLVPGCYVVTVVVDSRDQVVESAENDNRVSVCLVVAPGLANLHPRALILSPASPVELGESLVARIEIENNGGAAAGAFTVTLRASNAVDPGDSTSCPALLPATDCEGEADRCIATIQVDGLDRDRSTVVDIPFSSIDESLMTDAEIDALEKGRVTSLYRTLQVDVAPASVLGNDGTPLFEESTRVDNAISTSLKIVRNPGRLCELRATDLTIAPKSPLEWGEQTDATVTIENQGGRATDGPVDVRFEYRERGSTEWKRFELTCRGAPGCNELEDTVSTTQRLDIEEGLNSEDVRLRLRFDNASSGSDAAGNTGFPLDPGEYELRAVIDPRGLETERDENNNVIVVGFTIEGAELHPIGLTLSAASILQGDDVAVTVPVENSGSKNEEYVTVGFFVDGTRMDTFYYVSDSSEGLQTNERFSARGYIDTTDLPVGEHVLRVVVDPDDQIPEVDDGNNEISVRFHIDAPVPRRPELVVEEADVPTGSGRSIEGPEAIACTVANRGNLPAEGISVALTGLLAGADGRCEAWAHAVAELAPVQRIARLEPGERVTIRWEPIGLAEPICQFCFEVDVTDEIEEMDERNNCLLIGAPMITFSGGHVDGVNLLCRDITVTDGSNQTSIVRGWIQNNGVQASGAFQVRYSVVSTSGVERQQKISSFSGLASGQSTEFGYSVNTAGLPAGIHYATIEIDSGGAIEESDETDNVCTAAMYVGGTVFPETVDLQPVSVRFGSPDAELGAANTIEQGRRLYLYVTVRNNTPLHTGPFVVSYMLDGSLVEREWPGLGPLAEGEVVLELPTSVVGAHTLGSVIVDPHNVIQETDETNNALVESYSYAVAATPTPGLVPLVPGSGIPRWLFENPITGNLIGVWSSGGLKAFDGDGATSCVLSIGETVEDVAVSGASSTAYIASGSTLHVVDFLTCERLTTITQTESIRAVVAGNAGVVYLAFADRVIGYRVTAGIPQEIGSAEISGSIVGLRFDGTRNTLYVLSSGGLFSVNGQTLASVCSRPAAAFDGAPTALVIGEDGLYVGTSQGVVYALSFCRYTGTTTTMAQRWRYPAGGSLGSAVDFLAVDPRVLDPLYVVTADGRLRSVDDDGLDLWEEPFAAGGPIIGPPTIEQASGRIALSVGAVPPAILVLTLDGEKAFDVDLTGYSGGAPASPPVMIAGVVSTPLGVKYVRAYYFGAADGIIYEIESQR